MAEKVYNLVVEYLCRPLQSGYPSAEWKSSQHGGYSPSWSSPFTLKDPGSGIHPFLPVRDASELGTVAGIIYRLGGLALASIRLPLLVVFFLLWIALLFVLQHLSGRMLTAALARRTLRAVDCLLGHIILFLLGYLYIPVRRMAFRGSEDPSHISMMASRSSKISHVEAGDLVLANSQSPVDVIFFCTKYRLSPVLSLTRI